tara:strand:- start:1792 stop:2157 length:366 start_codon:yes stop_codon:yes gene_type:complete
MSRRKIKREEAIYSEFDSVVKKSASSVSELVKETGVLKLFVVFLHDNLLNAKGDMTETDRVDLKNELVPLYPQLQANLAELTALFNIYDDDPVTWQANFDAYLASNPTLLTEAINRFPSVE